MVILLEGNMSRPSQRQISFRSQALLEAFVQKLTLQVDQASAITPRPTQLCSLQTILQPTR